ncbi:coiled-coil domain-containing protein [Cryptosporangium sp. NPDC051539]|uniref:coiled-coil domain-containing protein n=1 Tax=Cryptosporangium sp. NPDC051539 TaxID=3363962 RepID=UPI0037914A07
MTYAARRRFPLVVVTVFAVLLSVVAFLPRAALAADDDEGGTGTLRQKLDAAATGYNNAKAKVAASQKRQKALIGEIAETEKRLTTLTEDAQRLGAEAYKGGMPDPLTVLANSGSAGELVAKASYVDTIARQTSETLKELRSTQTKLTNQRQQVEQELKVQKAQEKTMATRRTEAERALVQAGGGDSSAGFLSGTSAAAQPAPRNSDGSWPSESCSIDDPTSDGCVTPRMLHTYNEARADGFTHFTHCFRQASFGEHPKGRACDFAADVGGFGGVATGDSKAYGDRLAAWGVDNADRLGVLYVIWFRQIWLPGSGWKSYSGDGTPSGNHENHVHISVQ